MITGKKSLELTEKILFQEIWRYEVAYNRDFFQLTLFNSVTHYVNSILIRSYSGPHLPAFWLNTERDAISLSSVRMQENADQNNSEYGYFLRSDI